MQTELEQILDMQSTMIFQQKETIAKLLEALKLANELLTYQHTPLIRLPNILFSREGRNGKDKGDNEVPESTEEEKTP